MTEEQFPRRNNHDGFFCRFTFGQFFALLLLEVFTLFFIFYLGARYGREFFNINGEPNTPVVAQAQAVPEEPRREFLDSSVLANSNDPDARAMADDLIAKAGTPELKEKIASLLKSPETAAPSSDDGILIVGNSPPTQVAQPSAEVASVQAAPVVQPVQATQNTPASFGKVTVITADGESKTLDEADAYQQLGNTSTNAAPANQAAASTATPGTPLTPQGAVKVKNSGSARFSIQVGSYPQLEEANHAVEGWKTKGYPAYMMIADIPDRGRWYRVRIGGFAEKNEADAYLTELTDREKVDALVVYNEQ